jgi:hypothetical protein
MRAADAAKRVGVSKRTIYRWIDNGWLRATRVYEPTSNFGGYWRADISIDDLIEADDVRSEQSVKSAAVCKRSKVSA